MDNLYIYEELLEQLRAKKQYALGTSRKPPKAVHQKEETNLERRREVRGTIVVALNDTKTTAAVSVYDKKPVYMMTSVRRDMSEDIAPRTGEKRPVMLSDYNNNMNGVDRHDQYRWQRPSYMKSVKWWKCVFFFLLDVCLINGFIVYKNSEVVNARSLALDDYRRLVIEELTKEAREQDERRTRKRPGPNSGDQDAFKRRKTETHTLVRNPDLDRRGYAKQLRCRRPGCMSKTSSICAQCKVGYCHFGGRSCFNVEHGLACDDEI